MHGTFAAVAAALLGAASVAQSCAAARPPRPAPDEFVRGQMQRIIKGPMDRVWDDTIAVLGQEGTAIDYRNREAGIIACRRIRTKGHGRNLVSHVGRIAELRTARGRLRSVSEYTVEYTLFLAPSRADTSMKIVAEILATDRTSVIILGPGVGQVIPMTLSLPSRGVVERQLFRKIAAHVFSAEEMLHYVDDLGYE